MLGAVVSTGVEDRLLDDLLVELDVTLLVLPFEEVRAELVLDVLAAEDVARLLVEFADCTGALGVCTSVEVNGDQLLTASPALML
jgi:hypothetical protein